MGSKSAPSLLAVRWMVPSSADSRLCWLRAVPRLSYSFGGQTLIREKSILRFARARVFWFVADRREVETWASVDMVSACVRSILTVEMAYSNVLLGKGREGKPITFIGRSLSLASHIPQSVQKVESACRTTQFLSRKAADMETPKLKADLGS
jgi:hypothetical protein